MNSAIDIICLDNVHACYHNGFSDGSYALDGVSFRLPAVPGLVALTGPNGCGKTTILRVIMGQLEACKGDVWFRGENVTKVPTHQRHGLSCIFQRALDGLCASLTIEENLCLALTDDRLNLWRPLVNRKRRELILNRARELDGRLASSFLREHLPFSFHKYPNMFSGGEVQQICLFAVMLQQSPTLILLADEPTLNLDRSNREVCLEMLSVISQTTTVLVATHDKDLIAQSDRVLSMEHGRMIGGA